MEAIRNVPRKRNNFAVAQGGGVEKRSTGGGKACRRAQREMQLVCKEDKDNKVALKCLLFFFINMVLGAFS